MLSAAIHSKLNSSSYLVTKSIKELYDAVPASSPISASLIATPPTVAYRCRVTLSASSTHTDCAGSVTVGSDTLTFAAAGTKICTTTITASTKPAVSYSGIDCNLKIECVDVGGQPIYSETLTSVDVSWNDTQKWIPAPEGGWTAITATTAETDNSTIDVGDILRKTATGVDYTVKAVKPVKNFLGLEIKRRLTF